VRLKDLEGLEQQACAERMRVSRPTFHRILWAARRKIAEALVCGKAIRIGGGHHAHYTGAQDAADEANARVGTKAEEASAMRIAVSAEGPGSESQVDERFGWCPYFVICDGEDGDALQAQPNPAAAGSGGAGIAAGQFLDGLGVGVVLTGRLGPNAEKVVRAAGIRPYAVRPGMTVREALAAYRAGALEPI